MEASNYLSRYESLGDVLFWLEHSLFAVTTLGVTYFCSKIENVCDSNSAHFGYCAQNIQNEMPARYIK